PERLPEPRRTLRRERLPPCNLPFRKLPHQWVQPDLLLRQLLHERQTVEHPQPALEPCRMAVLHLIPQPGEQRQPRPGDLRGLAEQCSRRQEQPRILAIARRAFERLPL